MSNTQSNRIDKNGNPIVNGSKSNWKDKKTKSKSKTKGKLQKS